MNDRFPSMPDALAPDWRSLAALIAAVDERDSVPCRRSDLLPIAYWTSEHPEDMNLAAQACHPCPLIAQCAAYGLKHPKEAGVYGGLVPNQREPRAAGRKP